MTPQGLAVTDEYVLVSAYCHTENITLLFM